MTIPGVEGPADGDFARYVEHFGAGAMTRPGAGKTQPHEEHTRLKPEAAAGAARQVPTAFGENPLGSKVAMVVFGLRAVVLLIAAFQGVALWKGQGVSWSLLIFLAMLWVFLGAVKLVFGKVLSVFPSTTMPQDWSRLKQQLEQKAQQQRQRGKRH